VGVGENEGTIDDSKEGKDEVEIGESSKQSVDENTPFILSMLSALNPFVAKLISGVIIKLLCSS